MITYVIGKKNKNNNSDTGAHEYFTQLFHTETKQINYEPMK